MHEKAAKKYACRGFRNNNSVTLKMKNINKIGVGLGHKAVAKMGGRWDLALSSFMIHGNIGTKTLVGMNGAFGDGRRQERSSQRPRGRTEVSAYSCI